MTLFLIPLDCTYTVESPELQFYNQEFPTMRKSQKRGFQTQL